jgi:hypothetical protein
MIPFPGSSRRDLVTAVMALGQVGWGETGELRQTHRTSSFFKHSSSLKNG